MRDGVDAADVGEEAIAEALARGWRLRKAGDVDDVDGGVDLAGVSSASCEPVEPRVGHGDDAQVGLGRRVRVGGRRGVGVRQSVEEGRLADVGQTDQSQLHVISLRIVRPGVYEPMYHYEEVPQAQDRAQRQPPSTSPR